MLRLIENGETADARAFGTERTEAAGNPAGNETLPAPAPAPAQAAADPKKPPDELEVLIRARYPIIYVVTWEEETGAPAQRDRQERNKTFHVWTCSQGVVKFGAEPQRGKTGAGNTCDPIAGLDAVLAHVDPAIFLFKDLHDHPRRPRPPRNLRNVRRLRDVAHALRDTYKTGRAGLAHDENPRRAVEGCGGGRVRHPVGRRLQRVARPDHRGRQGQAQDHHQPRRRGPRKLVHAARGLTLKEAENVFAKTLVLDGKLDADDISVVFSEKQQIIRKSGTLEYYDSQEEFSHVAGLENLKEWLRKRSAAFSERAAQFGLPAPKGVLLLGVQGCGKSLCAKAASSLWKLPLLRFDIGRVFGSLVGSSEESMRRGAPDGRERRAGDPLDRRDRQGVRRHSGVGGERRRYRLAGLWDVPDLAVGEDLAGVRHRHGQRHQPPPTRDVAQGTRRRNLFRGPAQRGRAA